jgi:DNA mismatch endonuclease (patch repair protein)
MTTEATRHVMQANKGTDTKPELLVRRYLRAAGLTGYRLHWKKAAGRPDVCFPGRHIAIFVNGCFWHRCPHCDLPLPKSNVEFWQDKFAHNQARDARDQETLVLDGWTVVVVWECMLKPARVDATMRRVVDVVTSAGETDARALPAHVVEVGTMPVWRRWRSDHRRRRRA